MAQTRKFSLLWGNNVFYFVETVNSVPQKVFSAPFNISPRAALSPTTESIEGIRLTAIIQQALQNQRILDNEVSLALPAKDIIFRSFVLPWMPSSEVKNAVAFEATKFVPFKLEDLVYTFHPITYRKKKGKRFLRIIFVAMRKDLLEKYCSVLEHSGLILQCVEPSSLSMVRALIAKKLIPRNKITAIIEIYNYEGRIIIVDQHIPQFVREFQLYPTAIESSSVAQDILAARLFNEVKISFDYYGRQYNQKAVEKLLILSEAEAPQISENLGKDFNLASQVIQVGGLLGIPHQDIGFLSAWGACLRSSLNLGYNFDLPWKVLPAVAPEEAKEEKTTHFAHAALIVAACLAVFALVFNFSQGMVKNNKLKVNTLREKLGVYETATQQFLDEETQSHTNKLLAYQNIRLSSRMAYLLKLVSSLLPPGSWLKDISIQYYEVMQDAGGIRYPTSKVKISFSGYVYAADAPQQFSLVNTLVLNFKNNKEFSTLFDRIELGSVQRQNLQQHTVTTFRIDCQ